MKKGIFHIAPKVFDSFLEFTSQASARLTGAGKIQLGRSNNYQ
jgi:hypothetical protein